jgi:putative ABC transport system ATP-binding protein
MNDVVIQAEKVTRVHDVGKGTRHALSNVDCAVKSGEFVAVLGPSGSGKSTLLSIIGGLDRAYQGKVFLWGQDIGAMSDTQLARLRGKQIGFVFQHFHLLTHLSVLENVTTPALFDPDADDALDVRRAQELLERLGLADRTSDTPAELSGGQRQRVAIARALLRRPKLLLCDEPTGNLDVDTGAQTIALFEELHRQDGLTIVAVTHEERLARVASRVVRLRDGCIETTESA